MKGVVEDDYVDTKLKVGPFNDAGEMPLTMVATLATTGETKSMTQWLTREQTNAFISALTERLGL